MVSEAKCSPIFLHWRGSPPPKEMLINVVDLIQQVSGAKAGLE